MKVLTHSSSLHIILHSFRNIFICIILGNSCFRQNDAYLKVDFFFSTSVQFWNVGLLPAIIRSRMLCRLPPSPPKE